MSCYPGPYYGPISGPYGPCNPCNICVGPCVCGPVCGPCPPLVSGVGKFCPPPPSVGTAWEIDLLPMTGATGNIWQPTYTHNLRESTAITSITINSDGHPVVTYNLQRVKGHTCSVSASLVVTRIVDGELVNRVATASTNIQPYTTTITLTFVASPSIGSLDFSQSTLTTKFV